MSDELTTVCDLPNGYRLYVKPNGVGGRQYWSDEIGGGILVFDTSLHDTLTIITALTHEMQMCRKEQLNPPQLIEPVIEHDDSFDWLG